MTYWADRKDPYTGQRLHPDIERDLHRGVAAPPQRRGRFIAEARDNWTQPLEVVKDTPRRERPASYEFNTASLLDAYGRPDMQRVEAFQSLLPPRVQQAVAGRQWSSFESYVRTVNDALRAVDANVCTDDDIASMSLEEFDARFDEHGQPRATTMHIPTGQLSARQLSATNVHSTYLSSDTHVRRTQQEFDEFGSPELDSNAPETYYLNQQGAFDQED